MIRGYIEPAATQGPANQPSVFLLLGHNICQIRAFCLGKLYNKYVVKIICSCSVIICCHITGKRNPDSGALQFSLRLHKRHSCIPWPGPPLTHLASCVRVERVANTNPKIREVGKINAHPSVPDAVALLALVAVLGLLACTLVSPFGRVIVVALPVLGRMVAISV